MITSLVLHGKLGHLFGREWNLDVATPAEALRALFKFRPTAVGHFRDSERNGVVYRVVVDGKEVSFHERLIAKFNSSIHIYAIPVGSKRAGLFQTILGAVLIVVGLVITGGTFGAGSPFGSAIIMMGISMMVGGIAQMIANPKMPKAQDAEESKRGYLFSGSAMTSKQGAAVPVGYGKLFVGPIIVSAGMSSDRYNDYASSTGGSTGGGSAGGGYDSGSSNGTGYTAGGGSTDTPPPYTYTPSQPGSDFGHPVQPIPDVPINDGGGWDGPRGGPGTPTDGYEGGVDYWWGFG